MKLVGGTYLGCLNGVCTAIYIYHDKKKKYVIVEKESYTQTYCTMCMCCEYPPPPREKIVATFEEYSDVVDFVRRYYGVEI